MHEFPKLQLTTTSTATTYHFRAENLGWALATVNDGTGELTVCSDWGNWTYRWSPDPKHLGAPSLTHFIANRSVIGCGYLAQKLTGSTDRGREFDAEETVKEFRKRICERRLESGRRPRTRFTADLARELWDRLDDLRDLDRHPDAFIERFLGISDYQMICEEPWECLEYTPTTAYQVLLHSILPALVEACSSAIHKDATPVRVQP